MADTTTENAPILSLWNQSEADVQSEETSFAFDSLRNDAEATVLNARAKQRKAAQAVKTTQVNARAYQTGAFAKIEQAVLSRAEADLELESALQTYEELFGEKARVTA